MKFKANFSPVLTIIFWIMAVTSLVGLVIGILLLSNVQIGMLTVGQGTILIEFCPVAIILSLMLATVHYKLTDTHLQLRLAFWDVLGGRIRIDHIVNIVKKDNKLYISFLWKGNDPVIAQIAVSSRDFDKMKALLMDKNPLIVYYDDDAEKQKSDKNDSNESEE